MACDATGLDVELWARGLELRREHLSMEQPSSAGSGSGSGSGSVSSSSARKKGGGVSIEELEDDLDDSDDE